MKTVTLGNTGITVNRNGFGALPIQRISVEEAGKLLRKAYGNCSVSYKPDSTASRATCRR